MMGHFLRWGELTWRNWRHFKAGGKTGLDPIGDAKPRNDAEKSSVAGLVF